MQEILRLFPPSIRQALQAYIGQSWDALQEIRVRIHQPIELVYDHTFQWLHTLVPSVEDGMHMLDQLSEFSLYRMENELRNGYITIEGGHRVGLAGQVNTLNGYVKAIQPITFFNIRIAKEQKGCADMIIPHIHEKGIYQNTLLVGAPQTGKTTLLRDLTRHISSGQGAGQSQKVVVIDERSELGGSLKGIPQHDLGPRTDIMDACPKAEGMMMVIRAMSPDILIVDELGTKEDMDALMEALHTGVTVICTIHGHSLEDLKKRPSLQQAFDQNVFERYVMLGNKPGNITAIFDQHGHKSLSKKRWVENDVDWRHSFNQHNDPGGVRYKPTPGS